MVYVNASLPLTVFFTLHPHTTYATNIGTISQLFGGEYLSGKGHLNTPERENAATNPLFVF